MWKLFVFASLCTAMILGTTRWSYAQITIPFWLTKSLTWIVLVWEAGFPVWVALPWTRKAAFLFGVAFHLGIGLSMELGSFVPYALCLYLPLVPWERMISSTRKQFQ